MTAPARNLVLIALTLAGVAALNVAVFAVVFGWDRPAQIAAAAAAILIWAVWLALCFRLRDAESEDGDRPMLARSGPFGALTLIAALALAAACWAFAWRAPWPVTAATTAGALALWAGWFVAYRARVRESGGPGGEFSPPDAARNRYMLVHVPFVLVYVFALIFGSGLAAAADSPALRAAAVAIPALVLAAWAWEFTRMIRRADEMVKAAHYRALAIAGGVLLLAQSFWAIAETALGAPSYPTFLLLPAYAVIYAAVLPFQGAEA